MTVVHVSVSFTDPDDDARLKARTLSEGFYNLAVDNLDLGWFGDDSKQRLLAVLARLTREVEALP